MNYEELTVIKARKTVWPENKVVEFDAYDKKEADDAYKEVMNWYSEKDKTLTNLEKVHADTVKELKKITKTNKETVDKLTKENTKLTNELSEINNKNYLLEQVKLNLEKELSNSKDSLMTANYNFSEMSNRLNDTLKMLENSNKDNTNNKYQIEKLKEEKETLLKETEVLKKELEKLKEELTSAESTFSKISSLAAYYNEWKKSV